MRAPLYNIIICIALLVCCACRQRQGADTAEHRLPDTLRVATLYSPTSYFLYRDMPMGYDYSLIDTLAKDKGMVIDLNVASSMADAMAMLDSGLVDIIAYEVPVTSEYKESVLHCGPENITSQVLVQPTAGRDSVITDVTQLIGRDVYVEAGSKYQQRMENLNAELGGGINIHTVDRDTLITEDLIEMVSKGEIPLTVVDSDIARLNKTYYPQLDISLEVGFPQKSAWAVSKQNQWLADSIDEWFTSDAHRKENDELLKRYFEMSKLPPATGGFKMDPATGRVSPYDDLFKKYTEGTDIDWRLLAAIGFVESRYNKNAVSWAGARGIMQVMPATARGFGVSPAALTDPNTSIKVAVKLYNQVDKALANKIPDKRERQKFILASYNAGLGHVYDAIAIANNTGRKPDIWFGSVEEALALKSKPEYYNQPYCRNGYLRGNETINYVQRVMDVYDVICKNV